MSTEAIYAKYWAALVDVEAVMVPADTAIALALRLAVADAYDAGLETCSGMETDLAAIVASQEHVLQNALEQIDWLREERNALLRQLAQLDADNADLTQQVAGLAGVLAEAGRLRQELADLREQVIPDYQNSLASLSAEIDRLTRQNVSAVGTLNSPTELHSNGNGVEAFIPDAATSNGAWYEGLDAETNDWRISLEAKRRRFGEIPKTQRMLLAQAFARFIGDGETPTQAAFNAHKPEWMPLATGIVQAIGVAWSELLAVMPSTVAP